MRYLESVPFGVLTAGRDPATCEHGWLRPGTGRCVFCNELLVKIEEAEPVKLPRALTELPVILHPEAITIVAPDVD